MPQVSGDLLTWNSGTGFLTTVSITNNADSLTQTVVVRDLTPMTEGSKRFTRLTVTMP